MTLIVIVFWHRSPCQLHIRYPGPQQQCPQPGGGTGHDWSGRVFDWHHLWIKLRLPHQPC